MKANRNMVLGATVGALVATGMTSAYAADVVEQPPQPPAAPMEVVPVATWAGPYAGVSLGYGFEGETSVEGGPDISTDGIVGGAFAGWNGQSDAFVYGIEGDIGYNGMEGDADGFSTDGGVDGSLRARAGFAPNEDVLVYGTAGGAAGHQELTVGGDSDSNTMLGWTAGAGVDVRLTEQSFARVEYRYTDLGSETFTVGGDDYEVDSTSNKIMVGFGMQF